MKQFDAIIIGSGQAGTPLVFDLAARGRKVAFIEKNKVGGTCVNVGCTPTKAYIASARSMWDIARSKDMGIHVQGGFSASLPHIRQRKDALVQESVERIEQGLQADKHITFIQGEARFVSDYVIEVNGEQLTAPQLFINVGSRSFVPEEYRQLPYLTNETILELTELPQHLVIIGGSYIGLEFGQMFRRFGAQVTILERDQALIAREDEEVSQSILDFLHEEKVEVVLEAKDISVETSGQGISVVVNGAKSLEASHLLLAIGRTPNTDLLQLQHTGIKTDAKGFIAVDNYCQTNVPGIFALGDCNGQGAFTHTAYNDFQIVQDFLFGDKSRNISSRIPTYSLFVDPPLGRCGLNRKQAMNKGFRVLEATRPMSKIARAREKGETKGLMQLFVDADTEQILGASVLGVGGDEIITGILNIMYTGASYKLLRDTVVTHPTVAELIPTTLENLIPVKK